MNCGEEERELEELEEEEEEEEEEEGWLNSRMRLGERSTMCVCVYVWSGEVNEMGR